MRIFFESDFVFFCDSFARAWLTQHNKDVFSLGLLFFIVDPHAPKYKQKKTKENEDAISKDRRRPILENQNGSIR